MTEPRDTILERLNEALSEPEDAAIQAVLSDVSDPPHTMSHLEPELRAQLFERLALVNPKTAADLLESLEDVQGGEILVDLPAPAAARILEHTDSDVGVDLLNSLPPGEAEAILGEVEDGYALEVRRMMQHAPDAAGGLMISEFLAYPNHKSVTDVIEDLRKNGPEYREYEVRYVYALDEGQRFAGHVSVRELLLTPHGRKLSDVGTKTVSTVTVHTPLEELENLLDRSEHVALPVLDAQRRMVGVVTRAAVQEALKERRAADLLKFGGIVGGEELRSMPYLERTLRRLAFLLPNVLLSYLAVSVIAAYEHLVSQLTVLAVVLPMVANLTGAAGNQAVAVSIRELTLDVATPSDLLRVWRKEVPVGLTNGIAIGSILALLTVLTRGLVGVALTVGAACAIASVFAVLLGSALPLLLRRLRVDPAMLSSPILTTLTDMTSFFCTLSLASRFLLT